ncbi:MAG: hypothetical protein RSP_17830 [Rhodanobacter sp.]
MADLFDKTRKPKPSATPVPAAPTGGRDLFGNAAKAKPAPQRQADQGVISDKAAAELKAAAAETAERMKAGAGKLVDQAGELASKAKSTLVPAVKTRVSGVQVTRKTWMLGAGVVVAIAGGAFAWHVHQATPAAPASSSTAAKATALGVESSTPAPAPAPVMKLPGWNVQAGLQVLSADTAPKQPFTCNLSFNPNVAGGWSHTATTVPGLIERVDDQHGVVQASTADVAQQALAAADFALEAKCLSPAQLQAQAKPPVAPVEAPKPAPVPTFVPQQAPAPAPAPVVAAVAKPTPAPVVLTPVTAPVAKPVVKAKAQTQTAAKPDTFEKDADAKLDAFFKQH